MNTVTTIASILITKLFPRMPIPATDTCGIVTFAGHKHVYYVIITLTSFYYQSKCRIPCTVIGDGTLTSSDIDTIKKHFPGIVILQSTESLRIKKILSKHPFSKKYRFSSLKDKFNIKLFDPFLLTSYKKIIYIDCDIIFLKVPSEILHWIHAKKKYALISSEYEFRATIQDSHWDIIVHMFIDHMKSSMDPSFTSGLFCLYREHYKLDTIERILTYIYRVHLEKTWTPEQFSLGVMLTAAPYATLPKTYAHITSISLYKKYKNFLHRAICIHTAFQAKPLFYPLAIKTALQTNFFKKSL